jgi:hypothetical protein
MFDALKKLIPWLSGLPVSFKLIVSLIILLIVVFLLLIIWLPQMKDDKTPDKNQEVRDSYNRMERTLSRLTISKKGRKLVDGEPLDDKLIQYYENYFELSSYLKEHPNDIKGAYEKVWELGGGSRVFISETNNFESVVSAFFHTYEDAKKKE